MATKTEIKRFLERKRIDSIKTVNEEKKLKAKTALEEFVHCHNIDISQIRSAIGIVDAEISKFRSSIKSDKTATMNASYCHSPIAMINELSTAFSNSGLAEYFSVVSIDKINDKYKTALSGVESEYTRLIAVTQNMNAKEGIALLKSLGFDTAELEAEKQTTTLITNIDARKLYIQPLENV